MNKTINKLIGIAIGTFALLIVSLLLVNFKTVKGDEVAVKETWTEGVILHPFSGVFSTNVYL